MLSPRWSSAFSLAALLAGVSAHADVPVVELNGVVHAVTAAHVLRAIDRADADGAPLLIVQLNTPGGLMSSMRDIIDKILASRTPVAVFVGPAGARAASAGFIITICADVAAMAPGTNMGAAHPVPGLGGAMDEVMEKKIVSDTTAYIRSKAERRGRNVEMSEKAVAESRSFTEREALDAKLIEYVVKDADELLRTLDGKTIKRFDGTDVTLHLKGQRTIPVPMVWHQAVLSAIANPEILFLLLLGALAGIGAEISHPGLLFPGILGTLCLVLFLFASQVVPVSAAGVLLILLAVALFVAEVKVTSYGLLTVAGIVAMILGAMMLVDAPVHELQVPLHTVVPAALAMALWSFTLVSLVLRAQRAPSPAGESGLIGAVGVAENDLDPQGWVRVNGERWRAVAAAAVKTGDEVRVVSVSGLTLHVRSGDKEA